MNRTINWVNKTEGRDKLCKAIQYGSRIIKFAALQSGNKDLEIRFNGLFNGMRDARKLFRLLKSVNELQKILEVLNSGSMGEVDRVFNLLIRFFFMVYWAFDNLGMLSQIKFINYDTKSMNKWAGTCWFLALLCTLVFKIYDLIRNVQKYKSAGDNKELSSPIKKKLFLIALELTKTVGDLMPSGMASTIFPQYLGVTLNDGIVGLGGLVSALITSWQLYD